LELGDYLLCGSSLWTSPPIVRNAGVTKMRPASAGRFIFCTKANAQSLPEPDLLLVVQRLSFLGFAVASRDLAPRRSSAILEIRKGMQRSCGER
jgi:hypothetical protein